MSIKLRFVFLLGVLLLGFLAAWMGLVRLQQKEAEAAFADARQVREQLLKHLLDLGGRSLPQLAASYAQSEEWNNLPSTVSADLRKKITAELSSAGLDAIWMLQPDGSTLFHVDVVDSTSPALPPLPPGEIARLMSSASDAHFFSMQGGELVEIGLQRSARQSQAGHYDSMMLIRRWNEGRLHTLSGLTESDVSVVWPDQKSPALPGKIVVLRPLLDWQGQTLRLLRAEQAETGLERILQTDARPARVFIAFGLLVVLALGVALQTWVLRPLSRIGDSLANSSPAALGALSQEKDELGRVARLVETSFAQSEALKKSEEELLKALDERTRLGRDLHDGAIQSLYAAGMGLASIRMNLPADQADISSRLEQTRGILNETIHDLRNFINGLEPEALKQKTFGQAVAMLLNTMKAIRPLTTKLDINDELAARLSLVQRVHALQIIREAVSNALRHGEAGHVSVTLRECDGAAEFEITDNGRGFDPTATASSGFGMSNLFERARDLDGELTLDSEPGKGTRIKLIFDFPS